MSEPKFDLLGSSKEKYNQKWFEQRAYSSIKKIAPGVWDYSDSLLLYASAGNEVYDSVQESDTPYARVVTKPEREYLAGIADAVVRELPDNFNYIDLGPGTEHKEQFFFDAIKKQGKHFVYTPVDIGENYLKLSERYAQEQGILVIPMHSSFEEVTAKLEGNNVPRFVSVGLTFSNYVPAEIVKLLATIAGKGGTIFINAQMRDRVDMQVVHEAYTGVASATDKKIELLGLDPATDISEMMVDDGVRVWARLKYVTPALAALGIAPGDKLLLLQSLRYTKESLTAALSETDVAFKLLDTGGSFVGALITINKS